MAQLKNTAIDGTLLLPAGTTATRPVNPPTGSLRYNTTNNILEKFNGSSWGDINDFVEATSTGTRYTVETVDAGISYETHVFTGSGTFVVTKPGEVEYLIVAGGGAGGGGGGGGGAGGVLTGTFNVTPQTYTVTVGNGGIGPSSNSVGGNGQNSSIFGLTAIGGGGGAAMSTGDGPNTGGSGGGGTRGNLTGAAGTAGQGNNGGNGARNTVSNTHSNGGGGGGAGSPGGNAAAQNLAGNGGIGAASSLTGYTAFYAGGGGGGYQGTNGPQSLGGIGGGGSGGATTPNSSPGENAAPNSGGGGGGSNESGGSFGKAGDGGSGIIVVRYRKNNTKLVSAPLQVTSGLRNSLVYKIDAGDPTSYNYGQSPTTVYDIGGGTTGTLINVGYSGANGGQFVFSGNGKITVPTSTTYKVPFPFAIIGWVRHNGTGFTFISTDSVNCGENGFSPIEYRGLEWSISSTSASYLLGCGSCAGSGRRSGGWSGLTIPANEWHHVAVQVTQFPVTFQRPAPVFYLNGVEIGVGSVGGTNNSTVMCYTSRPMTIGSRISDVSQLTGSIGEIRIYNQAIGGAAIKQDFEATRQRYGK